MCLIVYDEFVWNTSSLKFYSVKFPHSSVIIYRPTASTYYVCHCPLPQFQPSLTVTVMLCLHYSDGVLITSPLVEVRSIVTSMSVCLFVCLTVAYLRNHTAKLHQIFCTWCLWPRSSSNGVVICYVLPVLWMMSYIHNMSSLVPYVYS